MTKSSVKPEPLRYSTPSVILEETSLLSNKRKNLPVVQKGFLTSKKLEYTKKRQPEVIEVNPRVGRILYVIC